MNPVKEYLIKEETEKARQRFLELENLVLSHRKANRIPTLGATDIHDAAYFLLQNILALKKLEAIDEAPKIDESSE